MEERTPEGFTNLHAVVSLQELEAIADEYKRTAGYEIERLNERASFSVR